MIADGKESQAFVDIASANAFVQRGDTAYIGPVNPESGAAQRSGLVFSPNSKRLAYAAWISDDHMIVVVDGQSGPVFDQIGTCGLYFSQDSKHLAYIGNRAGMWHAVMDGRLSTGYDQIGQEGLQFSDDWKEVRFRALERGRWRTVAWQFSPGK